MQGQYPVVTLCGSKLVEMDGMEDLLAAVGFQNADIRDQ